MSFFIKNQWRFFSTKLYIDCEIKIGTFQFLINVRVKKFRLAEIALHKY